MAFGANLHVAQALTDLAVAYKPSADGFLRDKFFARKAVQHLSDKLRQISTANALLLHDLKVGADGRVPEVQYRIDSDLSYVCKPYANEVVVDDLDSGNADAALAHEQRLFDQGMLSLTIALEYEAIKNTLRDTAILTANETMAAADRWDNYTSTSSDPINDLLQACTLVRHQTGKNVNRIAMEEWSFNKMQSHPNVLDRVRLTGGPGAVLTTGILAGILRVDESSILITSQSYNSAVMSATISRKSFLGSDVVVAYCEDGGLYDFGLGHEFAFSGYGAEPAVVVKYRDDKRGVLGSNVIRVGSIVDFKVTNASAAYLFKGVLDTTNAEYGSFLD